MTTRILLVEDEEGLVLALEDLLRAQGYEVQSRRDGQAGLESALADPFDLMLLDLMLPVKNGLEVLKELRGRGSSLPVIILTARSSTEDKVGGLRSGADDYLPKPFDNQELLARVEALLRRSAAKKPSSDLRIGELYLDIGRASASLGGKDIALTAQEWRLLSYLAEHAGQTLGRERLLEEVWRYAEGVSSRTVDVHVAALRQKLERNPSQPELIITVRGLGYRLEGGTPSSR